MYYHESILINCYADRRSASSTARVSYGNHCGPCLCKGDPCVLTRLCEEGSRCLHPFCGGFSKCSTRLMHHANFLELITGTHEHPASLLSGAPTPTLPKTSSRHIRSDNLSLPQTCYKCYADTYASQLMVQRLVISPSDLGTEERPS